MTRLQRLYKIKELLIIEIEIQENKRYNAQQRYEQSKANNQCVAAKSCKRAICFRHTMCSFHLNKAAQASAKRDSKK